jgi:hypothetical protein
MLDWCWRADLARCLVMPGHPPVEGCAVYLLLINKNLVTVDLK